MLKHSKFEKFLLVFMVIGLAIMLVSWPTETSSKHTAKYFIIGLFVLAPSVFIYLLIRVAKFFDAVDSLILRSRIFDNFDLKKVAKIVMLASITTMFLAMFTGNVHNTPGEPEHNLTTQIFNIGIMGLMGSVPVYLWIKWIDLLDWVQSTEAMNNRNDIASPSLIQQQYIEPTKTHCLISNINDPEEDEVAMKNWVLKDVFQTMTNPANKEIILFGDAALIVQGIQPIDLRYACDISISFIVDQSVWNDIPVFPNDVAGAFVDYGIMGLAYLSDDPIFHFYARQAVEKKGGKFSTVSIAFTHPDTKESATFQVVSASDVLRMLDARI